MVVLKEVKNMFWALTLEKGVRYTQTVEKAFHMSMAALEDPGKKDGIVSVMISTVKAEFLLCSLSHKTLFNQPLDLNFTEGEEVSFFINGEGTVHLTGYQLEDDQDDFDDDYGDLMVDSDDDDDEVPKLVPEKGKKRKGQIEPDKPKKMKMETKGKKLKDDDDDDEFSDDDDDDDDENLDSFLDDEAELDEDIDDDMDEEMDDDEDDDDDEEEIKPQKKSAKKEKAKVHTPVSQKKKKENKEQPKTPAQEKQPTPAQTPSASGDGTESAKKKKKKKKKNKNKEGEADTPGKQDQQKAGQTPQKQGPQKKVLGGGVVMEEFNAGNGPTAQKGKMMHVYYVGKLQKDGKQFDSCTSGKPFKFRLGHKEVISGWDKGLEGMKVGGKRRLVVPPKEGYGNQRQGPIPPNSTLIFDIELKSVS